MGHAAAADATNLLLDAATAMAVVRTSGQRTTITVPHTGLRQALLSTPGHPGLVDTLTC